MSNSPILYLRLGFRIKDKSYKKASLNLNWNWARLICLICRSAGAETLDLCDGFSTSRVEIFVLLSGDIVVAADQTESDLDDQ